MVLRLDEAGWESFRSLASMGTRLSGKSAGERTVRGHLDYVTIGGLGEDACLPDRYAK